MVSPAYDEGPWGRQLLSRTGAESSRSGEHARRQGQSSRAQGRRGASAEQDPGPRSQAARANPAKGLC